MRSNIIGLQAAVEIVVNAASMDNLANPTSIGTGIAHTSLDCGGSYSPAEPE